MSTSWKLLTLAVVAVVFSSSLRAGQAAGQKQIDALATEAATMAKKWLNDEFSRSEQATLNKKVKAMRYDAASLAAVSAHIKKARNTSISLYVINQVTKPLRTVEPHVAKDALADFSKMHQKLSRYITPKKYKLTMPNFRGKVSPDTRMAAIARIQKQMERNIKAMTVAKKHNHLVHELNMTLFSLMLLSGDPKEDDRLLKLLGRLEKIHDSEFIDILTAITSNADKLGRERAIVYYDWLVNYGNRVRMKRRTYTRRFDMTIIVSKGGVLVKNLEYTGIHILGAASKMAKAAGKPKVSVPSNAQVNEFLKKKAKKKK